MRSRLNGGGGGGGGRVCAHSLCAVGHQVGTCSPSSSFPSFACNAIKACHMTSHGSIKDAKTLHQCKMVQRSVQRELWSSGVCFDAFMSLLSSPFSNSVMQRFSFQQVQTGWRALEQAGLLNIVNWNLSHPTELHFRTVGNPFGENKRGWIKLKKGENNLDRKMTDR